MNQTTYRTKVSPYQPIRPSAQLLPKAYDLSAKEHHVRAAMRRFCDPFQLAVSFEEDVASLEELKAVPGLLVIKCTIRKDGQVLGIGRGFSTISRINRSIERSGLACINGSFLSASNNVCKALDAIRLEDGPQAQSDGVDYNDPNVEPATERQIKYLQKLITEKVFSEKELARWENELGELTKKEAGLAIEKFTS